MVLNRSKAGRGLWLIQSCCIFEQESYTKALCLTQSAVLNWWNGLFKVTFLLLYKAQACLYNMLIECMSKQVHINLLNGLQK